MSTVEEMNDPQISTLIFHIIVFILFLELYLYPIAGFFFLKRERGAPGMDPPDVIELMTEPTSIRHYRSTGVAMPKPTRFHNDTSPLASCTTASTEGIRPLNTTSFRWFHKVQSVAKMRCHSAPPPVRAVRH